MERKIAVTSMLTMGFFLLVALVANAGVVNDVEGRSVTGLVIAEGKEKPLEVSVLVVIGLAISNVVVLSLWMREKFRHP